MKNKSPLIQKIEKLIAIDVDAMGCEIVQIAIGGGANPLMEILADKADGTPVNMEECSKLSQAISIILDVENVMEDKPYVLEVSSPGIDRPLTRLKDFEKYSGNTAKIEIEPAIENRKRFKGTLKGVKDENVIIEVDGEEFTIPSAQIERAKLVIAEELLASQKGKKKK
ncbi:MAG: ribosome maturation factor RimP [Proteobacteria bacterium]|nr:ribosome maturation factor RimP [Pseudomonadota bacterium]